nr:bifunctional DNA-formamidopyrimidine glycosylase/DNA-(apurinic or apyrimidinic site) lyase [Microbacterium halimionae]
MTGASIIAVEVLDARALTRHPGTAVDFEAALTGSVMDAVVRRGKFLWVPLRARNDALLTHLGMSGQMLLRASGAPRERHERVRIAVSHPRHGNLDVVFADQRTFGSLAIDTLVDTLDSAAAGSGSGRASVPSQVAHIARDPLDPAFSDADFRLLLKKKSSGIKRVLLDQTVVSGIGNIYADESLWAARIHPETLAKDIPSPKATELLQEVRFVLQKALAEGGTSFDAQYVNVNGQAGYFAHSLNAYGRTGDACPRCGHPIIRLAFANRSSHFCAHCQQR